jgi:hypothetical protein
MVRDLVEKVLFYRDGDKTFFEPEAFPWVASIETDWKAVRKELDALMVRREEIPNFQDVSNAQKALTEGDQWRPSFSTRSATKTRRTASDARRRCDSCIAFRE